MLFHDYDTPKSGIICIWPKLSGLVSAYIVTIKNWWRSTHRLFTYWLPNNDMRCKTFFGPAHRRVQDRIQISTYLLSPLIRTNHPHRPKLHLPLYPVSQVDRGSYIVVTDRGGLQNNFNLNCQTAFWCWLFSYTNHQKQEFATFSFEDQVKWVTKVMCPDKCLSQAHCSTSSFKHSLTPMQIFLLERRI